MNFYVMILRGENPGDEISYFWRCVVKGPTPRRSNFIFLVMCGQGAKSPEIKVHIFSVLGKVAKTPEMKFHIFGDVWSRGENPGDQISYFGDVGSRGEQPANEISYF